MMSGNSLNNWKIIGDSVTGSSHLRNQKVNQDAWGYSQTESGTAVAVADGHGSAKYIYSDQGAKMAVQVALSLLEEFSSQAFDMKLIKQAADYLPRALVQEWRLAVDKLDQEQTPSAERYKAYGTTLLATLLTPHYALYLQIGDGDMVIVNADGETRYPIAKNTELLANETYSLCEDRAVYHVELNLQFFENTQSPVLIFLSTDGYANSFVNEENFSQAVLDYHSQIAEHGIEKVQNFLPDWLRETSEQGSGDDVTVAILFQEQLLF